MLSLSIRAFLLGNENSPLFKSVFSTHLIMQFIVASPTSNSKDNSFCVTYCLIYFNVINSWSSILNFGNLPPFLCLFLYSFSNITSIFSYVCFFTPINCLKSSFLVSSLFHIQSFFQPLTILLFFLFFVNSFRRGLISNEENMYKFSTTTLEKRLSAKTCEICNTSKEQNKKKIKELYQI